MRRVSNIAMVRGNVWSLRSSRSCFSNPTKFSHVIEQKTQAGSSRKRHMSNYLTLRYLKVRPFLLIKSRKYIYGLCSLNIISKM